MIKCLGTYSLHRRENGRLIHKCHCKEGLQGGGWQGNIICSTTFSHGGAATEARTVTCFFFDSSTDAAAAQVGMVALIRISSINSFPPGNLQE